MTTVDLWIEAARDVDAEQYELGFSRAKTAVATLWPFLSLARSEGEFEQRLAMAASRIEHHSGSDFFEPVIDSLREDFRLVTAAQAPVAPEPLAPSPQPLQIFHVASGKWITVEGAHEGDLPNQPMTRHNDEANPAYFEEAGPMTGQTGGYPQHPTGADPIDPLNQQFPAQPQEWSGEGKPGWNENPMSFAPYRQANANPNYFAGGAEGVQGDQQTGFPADISLDESDDRVDEYGAVPPLQSGGTQGDGHPYSNAGNLGNREAAVDSSGIDWDEELTHANVIPAEWVGWYHVVDQDGKRLTNNPVKMDKARQIQREHRLSTQGSRHPFAEAHAFFDPGDASVRMVAAADSSTSPVGAVPEPPPAMMPDGPGAIAREPMETTAANNVRQRPSAENPGEVADEYESNTWDGPAKQRPLQPAEHRNINTPQTPQDAIPQQSSSTEESEELRRESARVTRYLGLNLGWPQRTFPAPRMPLIRAGVA